tara:strand:+ start:1644 stop:2090 length:447 start_codon:yes stop_codon:yes gene_type:complete
MKKVIYTIFILGVFSCSNESSSNSDEENNSSNIYIIDTFELNQADEDGDVFYSDGECPDIVEFTSSSVIWEAPDKYEECTIWNTTTGTYVVSNSSENMIEGYLSDNFFFENGDDDSYVGNFFSYTPNNSIMLIIEVVFENSTVTYMFN